MAISFRIGSVTFSDGSTVAMEPGGIVAVVGPNNSGKSACLRAINDKLRNPQSVSPVVRSIAANRDGTPDELIRWLESRSRCDDRQPGNPHYTNLGASTYRSNALHFWSQAQGGLQELGGWFCRLLTAEARVTAANPAGPIALTREAPQHPIHVLERNDRIEAKISAYFKKAFGADLIVHRGAGGSVPLMVGDAPRPRAGQDRVSYEYIQELERLPQLETQGDGMRSFAGVLLHAFVGEEPIILIDEPEAFLHPPQAKLLGRMLVKEMQSNRQMIVATHSTDVLRGLLSVSGNLVQVVRIQRQGPVNPVRTLDNSKIQQLWNDPLLRYSNILDGLFHEKVVICEADSDCRFYSAIADAVYELKGENFRSPDIMYTHCGGKARMPMVVRALRGVDVPAAVVVDFDILNDEHPLHEIIEAVGGVWDTVEPNWRIVKGAVDNKRPELGSEEVKREIKESLDAVTESQFPKQTRAEIEKILRRSSPWAVAKNTGKSYVPNGSPSTALEQLLTSMRQLGVFVVECGELEGFVRTVGGHGPVWVNEALRRELKTDPELNAARDFVGLFAL
jgi:ABC-type transporter Mla maintaining outer membrane lipid asymmetry ATPase subunit MlaF